jgi:hypothetical protein
MIDREEVIVDSDAQNRSGRAVGCMAMLGGECTRLYLGVRNDDCTGFVVLVHEPLRSVDVDDLLQRVRHVFAARMHSWCRRCIIGRGLQLWLQGAQVHGWETARSIRMDAASDFQDCGAHARRL